ncbi:TetR/AcrR family transcriptional regulator [Breoghania corrubedonensis]|uniref:TetR/AcrR family transcriptional regulator n=1 Tax=Breoghania corrubedonensis TaxID=665038 RepID=UPI001FE7A2C9|nr:TetR/AcrR family transcriptional regulator [Breoghania corrubedonensis]
MAKTPSTPGDGDIDKAAGKPTAARSGTARRQSDKERRAEVRRSEILHAAFDIFAEKGFAQTRLDDVARRAGIAKGTIYLYFPDKETLFVELLREAAQPVLGGMQAAASLPELPVEEVLRRIHALFVREILNTRRKHLLHLLMQEGPRFPAIAEFYYRDIVSNGLDVMARLGRRGFETGELKSDALARFPQLVMAPLLMSITWDALFENHQHLDVKGMLAAFRDLLVNPDRPDCPPSPKSGDRP